MISVGKQQSLNPTYKWFECHFTSATKKKKKNKNLDLTGFGGGEQKNEKRCKKSFFSPSSHKTKILKERGALWSMDTGGACVSPTCNLRCLMFSMRRRRSAGWGDGYCLFR